MLHSNIFFLKHKSFLSANFNIIFKFYLQLFFKFNRLIRIIKCVLPILFTEVANCLKWQLLCTAKNNLPAAAHTVLRMSVIFFHLITLQKKYPQPAYGKGSLLNLFTDQDAEALTLLSRHWHKVYLYHPIINAY